MVCVLFFSAGWNTACSRDELVATAGNFLMVRGVRYGRVVLHGVNLDAVDVGGDAEVEVFLRACDGRAEIRRRWRRRATPAWMDETPAIVSERIFGKARPDQTARLVVRLSASDVCLRTRARCPHGPRGNPKDDGDGERRPNPGRRPVNVAHVAPPTRPRALRRRAFPWQRVSVLRHPRGIPKARRGRPGCEAPASWRCGAPSKRYAPGPAIAPASLAAAQLAGQGQLSASPRWTAQPPRPSLHVLAYGMMMAAPVSRLGQTAPNR
jgi:hypothetical protein